MPTVRHMGVLLLVLGLSGQMGSARSADFTGSLDWAGFGFSLTDLDLGDGVTPLLVWTSQTTGVSVLGQAIVIDSVPDWSTALSAVDGSYSATASATTLVISASGLHSGMGFLEMSADRYGDFTLSPMTRVDFVLPAMLVAAAPAGVEIFLDASVSASGALGADFSGDGISVSAGQALAHSLQPSISNTGLAPATLHFSSRVGVNAFPAAPIPEPSQLALLLAGLGVVVGWSRRSARA